MLRSATTVHPSREHFDALRVIREGDALGSCRASNFVGYLREDNAAGSCDRRSFPCALGRSRSRHTSHPQTKFDRPCCLHVKRKKEKQSSQSIPMIRCRHCEMLSDFPGWNLAPPISWVVEASVRSGSRRRLGESHIFATAHASVDVLDLQLQMRLVLLLPVPLLP